MKRLLYFVFSVFAAFSALFAAKMLPLDSRELVDVKYAGWNGVLRVWIAEGWQPGSGSLVGWLNRCASSFEKKHNGVYVQVTSVSPEQLRTMAQSELRVPDAILFAPGMLEDADGLIPLPSELPLRRELHTSYYAAPVAMGGYAWALADTESEKVLLPADDEFHAWSAALLALSSGGVDAAAPEPPGLDLGLPVFAPVNVSIIEESETPFTDFTNGEAGALVVTQREIARLKERAGQGRGPDWTIDVLSKKAFTDQLLLFGIPACNDGDAEERRALSIEWLMHLLGEECQTALTASGAFPVTDAPTEYLSTDPLASLDLALRAPGLVTPPVFGSAWRRDARLALEEYLSGEYTASQAFGRLFGFSE